MTAKFPDVLPHLARREDILPIPGESNGADLGPVVRLEKGGDAAVAHSVPDLHTPVLRAAAEMLPVVGPLHRGELGRVLKEAMQCS